ncbi:MAG: hypothetical protein SVM80_12115 [Halobacteriota archaeon]|nr:hypothetical protein [Halobacteriota archaeon]
MKRITKIATISLVMLMLLASIPVALAGGCDCDCDPVVPCTRGAVRGVNECGKIAAVATEFSNGEIKSRGWFYAKMDHLRLLGTLDIETIDVENGELSGMANLRGYGEPVAFTITTEQCECKDSIILELETGDCYTPNIVIDFRGYADFRALCECANQD